MNDRSTASTLKSCGKDMPGGHLFIFGGFELFNRSLQKNYRFIRSKMELSELSEPRSEQVFSQMTTLFMGHRSIFPDQNCLIFFFCP